MPDRLVPSPGSDDELVAALRDLAGHLVVPSAAATTAADPARLARLRIEAAGKGRGRFGGLLRRPHVRPLRRGLVVGLVAVLAIAAVAGAIGLGVPGIRIVPGPAPSSIASAPGSSALSTSTSPGPSTPQGSNSSLGGGLGLGTPIAAGSASAAAGIAIILPPDPSTGPPASTWLLDRRVSFVWPAGPGLPPTADPAIGLILSEFRGTLQPGYFEKVIGPGTTLETVRVRGTTGWWVSGAPHEFVYVDAEGQPVFDSRRIVGETLMWSDGTITYRLESGLDLSAAIALADSLR